MCVCVFGGKEGGGGGLVVPSVLKGIKKEDEKLGERDFVFFVVEDLRMLNRRY